jgi:hypothetical protein
VVGSIDTAGPEVAVHPIRKFISPDIAMYWRPIPSSTSKTEYCELKGEMLVGSTDSSKYRSYSTSGPEVYLSGYCQVFNIWRTVLSSTDKAKY